MRIILSPAKAMAVSDSLPPLGKPIFLDRTRELLVWLQGQSLSQLKDLWNCNDKLAALNYERVRSMDLDGNLTPAVLAYDGIAYKHMAPSVFEENQLEYVSKHLRILSAFYGVLSPMDGVTPYRLEMQAKADLRGANLYEFWGASIYEAVRDDSGIIVNLASKEYAKCVEAYLRPEDCYITISFVELVKGKYVTKGTYAKMARGEMVRFMAEEQIEDVEEIKKFARLGYVYRKELSSETEFVFERMGYVYQEEHKDENN